MLSILTRKKKSYANQHEFDPNMIILSPNLQKSCRVRVVSNFSRPMYEIVHFRPKAFMVLFLGFSPKRLHINWMFLFLLGGGVLPQRTRHYNGFFLAIEAPSNPIERCFLINSVVHCCIFFVHIYCLLHWGVLVMLCKEIM